MARAVSGKKPNPSWNFSDSPVASVCDGKHVRDYGFPANDHCKLFLWKFRSSPVKFTRAISEIARPPQGHVKLGVKRFLVSSFSVKLSFVKVPVKLKVKNGLESRENRQNFDHFHSNRDKSD